MLRQRLLFGFVDTSAVLMLSRDGLARTGVAVADVTAREIDAIPGTLSGVVVRLDGAAPHDRSPLVDPSSNPTSFGTPNFDFYTMEVVQRIGYDSFTPDNGVLIARNKDRPSPPGVSGGNNMPIFTWTVDAHPEDIDKIDFKRPNGEPVMRTPGDYRQLNDALFHAGTTSGSQFEWEDTPNRLHFYVVDIHRDARGIRSYTLAVRSLDGAGPQIRGVSLSAPGAVPVPDRTRVDITLLNSGHAALTPADAHPRDESAFLNADVYRVSASVEGDGWTVSLPNALAAVKFGASQPVPVLVRHSGNAASGAVLVVSARSESDSTKVSTVRVALSR